jgi:hypothetical protein
MIWHILEIFDFFGILWNKLFSKFILCFKTKSVLLQITHFISFDETVSAEIIQQIVKILFIARERVVIIEAHHVNFLHVQFIRRKHSMQVHIFGKFLCCDENEKKKLNKFLNLDKFISPRINKTNYLLI